MNYQSPFENSPDVQAWRLARREATLVERERQAALRERELGGRDAARQRAEASLESEKERTVELTTLLDALQGRVAALESALSEQAASLQQARDDAEALRASLGRMTRREAQRKPELSASKAWSSGGRNDVAVALKPAPTSAAERWLPIDARPARRRRA